MNYVIPSPFIEETNIPSHRHSAICRLVASPPSRLTERFLAFYTLEEQVLVYKTAVGVLELPEYKHCWPQMGELARSLRDHLTEKHWTMLGRRALSYYQRFSEIATQGEFFSEAYQGFDKGLLTYSAEKGRAAVDGCKVKNWLGKQINLRILDFIGEKGGHFKMHPRFLKYRTYFSGGYDNRPEYKAAFESKHGLTTEESRARMRARYAPLISLTPASLDEQCSGSASTGIGVARTMLDTISDEEIGGGASASNAYTALQMERLAYIADFERHCDPKDYEIWLMVERDNYSQPEVAEMLDITKSDVLNAIRRVERKRLEYNRKVDSADRKLEASESRGSGSGAGNVSVASSNVVPLYDDGDAPKKRGRPSKEMVAAKRAAEAATAARGTTGGAVPAT
jgi:hypothetical protein